MEGISEEEEGQEGVPFMCRESCRKILVVEYSNFGTSRKEIANAYLLRFGV